MVRAEARPARPRSAGGNIADFERRAARRLPSPIWHYLQGGADDEWTVARNTSAFDEVALVPEALVDISRVDTSAGFLGLRHSIPLILSPTGMSQLFHADGEMAVARAAAAEGVLYSLSTMATTRLEDIAEVGGPRLFQLYIFKDRGLTRELIGRAKAAGYSALCLTVDTSVAGNRERDVATGMTMPPTFTLGSLMDFARHPRWLVPNLFGRPFDLANVAGRAPSVRGAPIGAIGYVNSQMDRTLSWRDLEWLRAQWQGPLVVKGIISVGDARRAVAAGCDALMISNHGGRQLDGCVSPFEQLPDIRAAVGPDVTLIVDGGVRRGVHVLKALALGADACSIGRPYLYGLAADGERGVRRVISIFREEIERGLALLGCTDVTSVSSRHLRRLAPLRASIEQPALAPAPGRAAARI